MRATVASLEDVPAKRKLNECPVAVRAIAWLGFILPWFSAFALE